MRKVSELASEFIDSHARRHYIECAGTGEAGVARSNYFIEILERLMKAMRGIERMILLGAISLAGSNVYGQIVINEIVEDQRDDVAGFKPDDREFVELYNKGASSVDISGWELRVTQIGLAPQSPTSATYTIPASTSIAAGGYYVIGQAGVPNVNFTPAPTWNGELFPNDLTTGSPNTPSDNAVYELRNGATLVDALALETFRDPERAPLTPELVAQVGGGYWGQVLSMDAASANPSPQSFSRWRDGRDTNFNGRDFGFMPLTPGTTNNTLPQNAAHTIPNVDTLGPGGTPLGNGTALHTQYYPSFVNARVVNPAAPDGIISTEVFPASPQGGKAIIAYDESGGGNVVHSKELVNKFDLYAFIETDSLSETNAHEASIYGIGTTDPFFSTPNSASLNTLTSASNGATGVGWLIQRSNRNFGSGVETRTVLQLINFDDSGESSALATGTPLEWQIIQSITLPAGQRAWHRLSIDYNPATGDVTAKHDSDTYVFNISGAPAGDANGDGFVDAADHVALTKLGGANGPGSDFYTNFGATGGGVELMGTFYTGYRENFAGSFAQGRPPTYDTIGAGGGSPAVPEPSAVMLLLLATAGLAANRRQRS
jgi:hypothetical protein